MNEIMSDEQTTSPRLGIASGLTIGLAIGQLANRQIEKTQGLNFQSLMKAFLALRDKDILSDSQFSELLEAACTVLIEKRVETLIEKVIEHQTNVNVLTKYLMK